MPTAEFDILSHFSVNLDRPSTSAQRRPSAATASMPGVKVLALREKAPLPPSAAPSSARTLTPHQSAQRSASAAANIVVVDAPVPCNDYINQQAALARQREREARRLRDQQAAAREQDIFAARERGRGMTAAEKEATRLELERAVKHAREEKSARRQQELRDARVAQFHLDAAVEAERLQAEAKKAAGLQLREELRRRAEEARAQRLAQRRSASAPDDGLEPLYLAGQAETERNLAISRQRQLELRQYWEEQMVSKRTASAAARDRDRLFAQEAEHLATRDERRDLVAAAQAKQEAQKNIEYAHQHRVDRDEQRRREKARERAEAERELAVAAEADRREAAAKHHRQQQLRDDIARLLAERKRQQQERTHVERSVERNRAVAAEDVVLRDVNTMYRCPATGRVLPPAAFNIPRTAWQAPSRAVIM